MASPLLAALLPSLLLFSAAVRAQQAGAEAAASLADIDHVVLFMQENRAFNHYFGTMAGVKGFSDPNVQVSDDVPIWEQRYQPEEGVDGYLMPWHINYLGGDWISATQCMISGSNSWQANHAALNGDRNDRWAAENNPVSWGFYRKEDIPVQWAVADSWTVGDMYMESVIGPTCPNRVAWVSGTINTRGNLYTDNNMSPGCLRDGINCYPIEWDTAAEMWQAAGVDWQVFQDTDNFDDNALAYFARFQEAAEDSPLHRRGMAFLGISAFEERAANGTLPAISYIVGAMELSEHPPYSPNDGAWLQRRIVEAVVNGANYNRTALFVSYDETGGWGDHVVPYHSPPGTEIEWVDDPYTDAADSKYTGPGFRLPFYIVSPYTRGGAVFTEPADHSSHLLFVEKWLAAKGEQVGPTPELAPWRRAHMSDLTAAFDFAHPDFSLPNIPAATEPHRNDQGEWDGSAHCEAQHDDTTPPVPWTKESLGSPDAIRDAARRLSERGFKATRGRLNEGRYLAFASGGRSLAAAAAAAEGQSRVVAAEDSEGHADRTQLWILHQPDAGSDSFAVSSAADGRWIAADLSLVEDRGDAGDVTVRYLGSGRYSISVEGGEVGLGDGNEVSVGTDGSEFEVFSVT